MKHYETLWEEAEKLSTELEEDANFHIFQIKSQLDLINSCDPNMLSVHFGNIIFSLCALSGKLNINTYVALQQAIIDKKSELLEPDKS